MKSDKGVSTQAVLTLFINEIHKNKEDGKMAEEKRTTLPDTDAEKKEEFKLSETWAQDALSDLEDWIEEQGIYIRQ